jgi:hypothetical protein
MVDRVSTGSFEARCRVPKVVSQSRVSGAGRTAWMSYRGISHGMPSLSTINVQESNDAMFTRRARD